MNKTLDERIKQIIVRHNEWNAFDDEIEGGYATVEMRIETVNKVVEDLKQLIKTEKKNAVEEYKAEQDRLWKEMYDRLLKQSGDLVSEWRKYLEENKQNAK